MQVIITGATEMVGEGAARCLENPAVERVLSVSRRPYRHTHPSSPRASSPTFEACRRRAAADGYDDCFYCAGVSWVRMKEPGYAAITSSVPLHFAQTLARLNPGMVLVQFQARRRTAASRGS